MKKILTLFFVVFCFQIMNAGRGPGNDIVVPFFNALIYIVWALMVYLIIFIKNRIFCTIHLVCSILIFIYSSYFMITDNESKPEFYIKALLFYLIIMFPYYFILYKRLIKNNEIQINHKSLYTIH